MISNTSIQSLDMRLTMIPLNEAQSIVRASLVKATKSESIPLADANRRFIARNIYAHVDNPAFDNSAMDGYAYAITEQFLTKRKLPVLGESSCGTAPSILVNDTCMRIFTGAPIPKGAQSVEMQEYVDVENGTAIFKQTPELGKNIRYQGEDFRIGDKLFTTGHQISPMDVGLMATAGVDRVPVYCKPKALVVATGNELVAPGRPLKAGQIYESNKVTTQLALQALGVIVEDGGTVQDDVKSLRDCIAGAGDFDFFITSGGVSVGDHDLVKKVFSEFGSINLWRVRIKPGKPIAFGVQGARTHFFALPGNPLSSLITFKLFVEPAIYYWNHSDYTAIKINAVLAQSFRRESGRMEFLRSHVVYENGQWQVNILDGQGSHMLGTVAQANCLVQINDDCSGLERGATVVVLPMREVLN